MTIQTRLEKVLSLKKSQCGIFTKHKHQNEASELASFSILAKAGKPFIYSEFEFFKTLHWKGC